MIPDATAAALARLEGRINALAWYQHCLHAWLTAGPHVDRAAVRRALDDAARALAPAGRVPVVSDPDTGPPEPMT